MATAAPPRGLVPRVGGLAGLTPTGRAVVPVAWALYDLANTIFTYAVVSYAMGQWTIDRLGRADGQFWFGIAAAASVLLNAIVSPVLGAVSDRGGRRLPYLLVFTAITVVATALLAVTDAVAIGLVLFAIANFRTRRRSSTTTRRSPPSRSRRRADGCRGSAWRWATSGRSSSPG